MLPVHHGVQQRLQSSLSLCKTGRLISKHGHQFADPCLQFPNPHTTSVITSITNGLSSKENVEMVGNCVELSWKVSTSHTSTAQTLNAACAFRFCSSSSRYCCFAASACWCRASPASWKGSGTCRKGSHKSGSPRACSQSDWPTRCWDNCFTAHAALNVNTSSERAEKPARSLHAQYVPCTDRRAD